MLSTFIAALQSADLAMTAEEIADTLWLALQMRARQEDVPFPHDADAASAHPVREDEPGQQHAFPQQPVSPVVEASAGVHLQARSPRIGTTSYTRALPFRSPAASALPHALSLARALRPLMRRLPSKTAVQLNERATAQRIAETQMRLWIPVLDPAPLRWFDLELVVDSAPSMVLWKDTVAELQHLLEQMGAFRNVRVWRLVTDQRDRVELYAGSGGAQETTQIHNPKELLNPSGSRLLLVATDCISPAWHSGNVQDLLNLWGQTNLVTLIQMLPRRLWSQTMLEYAESIRIHARRSGGSNRSLQIHNTLQWFDDTSSIARLLPLPTLTLEVHAFSSWAHMLTGTKHTWVTGMVFERAPADTGMEEFHNDQDGHDTLTPRQRVHMFRTSASSLARRLAGLLAAAPIPLSISVIRQVQSTMLPEANQVHVAEVFLGGLLEEISRDETHHDPEQVHYDFIAGVREELIQTVPIPDAHRVLNAISQFVRERYGQPHDFLALIAAPQREPDGGASTTKGTRPFAYVELRTLRRFGGAFVELIDELERSITRMDEQQNELYGDNHSLQTVVETPQAYTTTAHAPEGSAHASFLDETWCGFSWMPWLPLNSSAIPRDPGVYRVRAVGGDALFYIGSTGRSLRERIGDLYRNIMRDATQMPFSDPHTAAPVLWAWRDATGIDFECSALPLSSQDNLDMLVHYFLWRYHVEKGSSTLTNHGRSHPLYSKSGNRSTGRRGYRLPEGSSNPAGGPGLEPLRLEGNPVEKNWMGLAWSDYYPLSSTDFKHIAASPAVYKVIDKDKGELLLIESTPNLRNRLQDLKQKRWPCPHPEVAFVLQSPELLSFQLAELESDLLGAYYEQVGQAPKVQFGMPLFDAAITTTANTDRGEASSSIQDTVGNAENRPAHIPFGSHLCQLYKNGQEIVDGSAIFINKGLLASEKCLFVADSRQVKDLSQRLREAQLDIRTRLASGQLVLRDERDDFLVNGERFDPYYLLSSHLTFVAQALREGWKGARISIDMSWLSQRIATPEQILKYEALSDAVLTFQNTPLTAMMHYEQQTLLPSLVVEMLKLHPISLVGNDIKRNPYYLSSEQYMHKVLRIA